METVDRSIHNLMKINELAMSRVMSAVKHGSVFVSVWDVYRNCCVVTRADSACFASLN